MLPQDRGASSAGPAMDLRLPPPLSRARSLDDLLAFDRYVVVGANSGGDQVRFWLAGHGKEVAAFTDLTPSLCGAERSGLAVLAPAQCPVGPRTAFVIGTVRQREAAQFLIAELGVAPEQVFPFVNPMFAAHYRPGVQAALASRFAAVRKLLSDAPSRDYFDRALAFYRTLDARHLVPQPRRIGHYGYDAPGANPAPGAAIVDCGAYTGDTFGDFLAATGGDCHIYALEAFLPNLQRLTANVAARNLQGSVTPLHVAAARTTCALVMSGDETIADGCAHMGAGDGQRRDVVLGETLDNLFLEHLPRRIDYLKMDIEGADLDALMGAEKLLRAHRPVVAVAAYHLAEHVAGIAEFLHQTLAPCRIYAAHDPAWHFHIHYIVVPDERAQAGG